MIIEVQKNVDNIIQKYLREVDSILERNEFTCPPSLDVSVSNNTESIGLLLNDWDDIAKLLLKQLDFLKLKEQKDEFFNVSEVHWKFMETNFLGVMTHNTNDKGKHLLKIDKHEKATMTPLGVRILKAFLEETKSILQEFGYEMRVN